MNKPIRILLQIGVLLIIIGAVFTAWLLARRDEPASVEEYARPVRMVVPVRVDLDETVMAWGNLRSADQVSILPKVSGSVTSMNFEVGDRVAAGQVLAVIDRESYRLDFERAEAARAASASTWERIDRLYNSGSATRQDWESSRASHLAAEAQASAADLRFGWTELKSPTDGVVLMKHTNTGSLVSPESGQPIYTVGSLDDLEVALQLPEVWYPAFSGENRPGVLLTADSFPDLPITGSVKNVAPWVDPVTRSFTILCRLDSTENWLRPGMLISGEFILSHHVGVHTVPASALTSGKGLWLRDDESRAVFMELDNPKIIDDSLLVPSRLAGTEIVHEGQHFLSEGDLLHGLDGGDGK